MMGLKVLRRCYSARVGPALNSAEDIRQLLATPSWSSAEFLKRTKDTKVTQPLLHKLLKLSGLSSQISAQESELLLLALENQINFLDHLHSVQLPPEAAATFKDPRYARILRHEPEAVGYTELQAMVAEQKQAHDKGEVDDSWSPMDMAEIRAGPNYVIRGGLGKDEQ
ncbi:hypothetical protein BABINDRAFT_160648 [Babjeviella inositovora NRRL Y-12698]|uniref:Glu-AdT subunit F n=1 Tax=Babjeviella inositovora NRRL Y-12698 TaxID=984486 RepID=A0A1E3QUB2_9ASCO|nr:uncharacterized protein BABINDRAFT_160648 [Babjeviella inositovora NRRL Y-12698]ODQ81278.1 hypothetical protein BABINDRAFT_160648 [Babjeviella inositovora NRRL Y-12698]